MSAISTHPETASPRSARHSRRDTTRLVVAASIGNALEWFDLTAYADKAGRKASLIQMTGSNLSPAFYIMMIAALSLVTLVILRRRGAAS